MNEFNKHYQFTFRVASYFIIIKTPAGLVEYPPSADKISQ